MSNCNRAPFTTPPSTEQRGKERGVQKKATSFEGKEKYSFSRISCPLNLVGLLVALFEKASFHSTLGPLLLPVSGHQIFSAGGNFLHAREGKRKA